MLNFMGVILNSKVWDVHFFFFFFLQDLVNSHHLFVLNIRGSKKLNSISNPIKIDKLISEYNVTRNCETLQEIKMLCQDNYKIFEYFGYVFDWNDINFPVGKM